MNDPGSLSFSMAMAGGAEQTDVAGNTGGARVAALCSWAAGAGAPGVPAPRQLSAPGMGSDHCGVLGASPLGPHVPISPAVT